MLKRLLEILNLFKLAPRIGAEKDIPEGNRYIQISDTLANEYTKKVEGMIDDRVCEILRNDKSADSCKTCERYKVDYLSGSITNSGEKEPLWSGGCDFLLAWLKIENSDMTFINKLCVQQSFKCCFWKQRKNEKS